MPVNERLLNDIGTRNLPSQELASGNCRFLKRVVQEFFY